jgi:hypothetical protein
VGQDQAGHPFDWFVWTNGSQLAADICESAKRTGVIKSYWASSVNRGQHLPTNEAIAQALGGDYDYILRIDDDVEWLTKRWLVKLLEASQALGDRALIAPIVRGLKFPLQTPEETVTSTGIPFKLTFDALGGICRLHPIVLFKDFPYHADTRQPMGFGDATGIARWAQTHMVPLAITQNAKVRHAKTTAGQEAEDSEHFKDHALFQRCPYIPVWTHQGLPKDSMGIQ